MKKFFKKHSQLFILLFCLAIAFFFRVYNLNWDQGLLFHPDERNIDNAVTKIHFFSQLNPGFFAYGGFSIYLYRAVADVLTAITKSADWVQNWGDINGIGRFFSAIFSTITILPLFFIAKKLFGKKAAILASLFYVFTVTSIQHAHFGTTESSLTFFGLLLCWLSLWWAEKPTLIKSLLLGITFGISLATKTSALLTILFPVSALMLFALSQRKHLKKLLTLIPHILIFLSSTMLFAFLLSPYSILDFKDFYTSMTYESGVATGSLPVVYTYQFNGSIPYLFQIENLLWQLGPLLAIFAVVGMAYVVLEPFKRKEMQRIIFWIFPLVYFLYVGSWHTKFLRYMVPVIPFFIIAASYLLLVIQKRFYKVGTTLIVITLLSTTLWACAFFTIYTRPQTRIMASVWIYQHIPANTTILGESWDDGLPVPLGIDIPSLYNGQALDMYAQDDNKKVLYLASKLSSAEYVILNSKRLYGTLTRLTKQYPITSKYYKFLFAGKLGYTNVATFTSYPQLFGIQINDDAAEETFQVFDHTKVLIFKNTNHYSSKQLQDLLQ